MRSGKYLGKMSVKREEPLTEVPEYNDPVHGTIPQNLIEKIVRLKIYNCQFWKQYCFGLTAELLVDYAVKLKYFGGAATETSKPCPFLCLLMKMLQIQPSFEIVEILINNPHFKYMTVLGIAYLRLTGSAFQIYSVLEPYYKDYRKVRYLKKNGWELLTIDQVVHQLLTEEIFINIVLPRLPPRRLLIESNRLQPRISSLDMLMTQSEFDKSILDGVSLSSFSGDESNRTEPKIAKKRKTKKRKIKGLKFKTSTKIETITENSSNKNNKVGEEEFSVDYWNEQRKKLGLKPLH